MSTYTGSDGSISIEKAPDGTTTITIVENGPPKKETKIKVNWRSDKSPCKSKSPLNRGKTIGEGFIIYTGIGDNDYYYEIIKLDCCDIVIKKYTDVGLDTKCIGIIRIKGIANEEKEKMFKEIQNLIGTEYIPRKLGGVIIKSKEGSLGEFEVHIPPRPDNPLPAGRFHFEIDDIDDK